MTDWLGQYKNLLNHDEKNNDGFISASKQLASNNFKGGLFNTHVSVDGIERCAILKQEKKNENKKLIFPPDTKVDIGSVVKIKDYHYLIMNFLGDGINEVYPTAELKLCNSTFPIESDKFPVLLGYDKFKRAITDEVSNVKDEPCIVETKYYFNNRNEQITLPEDRIMVTLKYQESSSITVNHEFPMYNSRFRITHVDYSKVVNGKGIISVIGERVMNK